MATDRLSREGTLAAQSDKYQFGLLFQFGLGTRFGENPSSALDSRFATLVAQFPGGIQSLTHPRRCLPLPYARCARHLPSVQATRGRRKPRSTQQHSVIFVRLRRHRLFLDLLFVFHHDVAIQSLYVAFHYI